MREYLKFSDFQSKRIVEIGCGEGQNFRYLIAPSTNPDTLYVALDVSLSALKLNRKRNQHENAIYVCASADNLPFDKNYFDLICLFGILHHTRQKEKLFCVLSQRLCQGGYFMVHEAVVKEMKNAIVQKSIAVEQSEHEERIVLNSLYRAIKESGLKIIAKREENSTLFF